MGFRFNRLGVRVPTIMISAYTKNGTVMSDPMHHGAVVKTLAEQHGLAPLTERDRTSASLSSAINLGTPRQPALWPDVRASYVPPNLEANAGKMPHEIHRFRPLTPPARGLLGLLLAKYEPGAPLPTNYADAYAALIKHGTGLFGVRGR